MSETTIPHPAIASEEEWLAARKELLAKEKAVMKQRDAVSAERRRLPMVKLTKTYEFDTPDGKKTLLDLFDGKQQLIVYHFMFGPDWEKGCPGCTGYVNSLGDISVLGKRDTTFTLISRAPLEKLEAYKSEKGWHTPWASSFGSDFNYDFHVTLDPHVAPMEYNYRTAEEYKAALGRDLTEGEAHGHSVFFRIDDDVHHTYSCYARSTEGLTEDYGLLDLTPYGRQEDWEDSPEGYPQKPTYG